MLPKNYSLRKILVVFSFFEIFCTRVGNSERFSQGFIHSESEVRYFGEDVPGVSQSFSEDQTFSYQDDEGTITVLGSPIKFDPPNLNFKEKPIDAQQDPCFAACGVTKQECATKCRAETCPPLGTEVECKTCMHECEKAVVQCKCDCKPEDPTCGV